MRIGRLEVWPVSDGTFRLDGGAMFGVVPKVLWERRAPADDLNRILLGLNCLLIRAGGLWVLVDAGIGEKLPPRLRSIFAMEHTLALHEALGRAGVHPDQIDVVIATHLHLDHAGGLTRTDGARVVPAFRHARHVIRRGEWEEAIQPHARNHASYIAHDFVPLADAGLVDWIEHDGEILPGVSVLRTGGHTRHHQIVRLESDGERGLFLADLVPTVAHLDLAWVTGYDLYPAESVAAKAHWLSEAVAGDYTVFFEHDPAIAAGRLREVEGRLSVVPVPCD